jgi:hypothetical protein
MYIIGIIVIVILLVMLVSVTMAYNHLKAILKISEQSYIQLVNKIDSESADIDKEMRRTITNEELCILVEKRDLLHRIKN